MKVVFLEEVFGTAVPGEVKEVKNGFARNYLLPRGLAVPATKSAMQQADALSKKEEKRQAQLDSDAQKLIEKLEGQQITITARVGEQGRLYGSVTSADIAAKLATVFDGEFDRRRVLLPAPIREVGSHPVSAPPAMPSMPQNPRASQKERLLSRLTRAAPKRTGSGAGASVSSRGALRSRKISSTP